MIKLIKSRAGIGAYFILTPKCMFFHHFNLHCQIVGEETKEDLKGRLVERDERGPSRNRSKHEQVHLEVKSNKDYLWACERKDQIRAKSMGYEYRKVVRPKQSGFRRTGNACCPKAALPSRTSAMMECFVSVLCNALATIILGP